MTNEATSGLTPELFQLALRLERIFMHQSRKQRIQAGFDDEHMQTPIKFVHYTSAEAALKIITGKRMWMRNTTCMADYREVQHGLKIIQNFLSDSTKTNAFVAALDSMASAATPGEPKLIPSQLIQPGTEVIGGVPQLVYKLPLDATVAPALADLDFSKMFDRLIIGPSPYPWVMYEAFVGALKEAGCPEVDNRVWNSNIPIRT